MRRTTLTLDERIFAALRRRAARENRSLRDVVNDLLRDALAARPPSDYRLSWTPDRGQGPRPGVTLEDRDALWDLMDGR